MDRAFMEQYFEMAYEDLHGVLMRENEELKEAHETLRKSVDQLFSSCKSDPNYQHDPMYEKFTGDLYLTAYFLMKYAYLKGAEDRDRMLG